MGVASRHLAGADFAAVLAADARLYPTPSPLSHAAIERWFSFHPEFGIVFTSSGSSGAGLDEAVVGTCIVVALTRPGWELLVHGQLSESQIDERVLFQDQRDDELGLHVYHVEKLDGWEAANSNMGQPAAASTGSSIGQPAAAAAASRGAKAGHKIGIAMLHELAGALARLNAARAAAGRPMLRVCGFSGLGVSQGGINLLATTYNCREREAYICQEYILRSGGSSSSSPGGLEGGSQLTVVEGLDQAGLDAALQRGCEFVTRARMLVLLPGEPSIVWAILKAGQSNGGQAGRTLKAG